MNVMKEYMSNHRVNKLSYWFIDSFFDTINDERFIMKERIQIENCIDGTNAKSIFDENKCR